MHQNHVQIQTTYHHLNNHHTHKILMCFAVEVGGAPSCLWHYLQSVQVSCYFGSESFKKCFEFSWPQWRAKINCIFLAMALSEDTYLLLIVSYVLASCQWQWDSVHKPATNAATQSRSGQLTRTLPAGRRSDKLSTCQGNGDNHANYFPFGLNTWYKATYQLELEISKSSCQSLAEPGRCQEYVLCVQQVSKSVPLYPMYVIHFRQYSQDDSFITRYTT